MWTWIAAAWLISATLAQTGGGNPSIVLDGNPPVFRVLNSQILPRLGNPKLTAMLKVTVDRPGAEPIPGDYHTSQGALVFRPLLPLEPGLNYRAEFKLLNERASAVLSIPKPKPAATTVVERVFPSAKDLPENQLKFYIHFSASMSRGEAVKRIHLLEIGGSEVKLPFLELDEELWDREYRRLTVLFDPGRIKRGLVPNQEVGPPLKEGKRYALLVDAEFADAKGLPLREGFRKEFFVGAPERNPIDPKHWQILAPAPGSSDPLVVDFPRPLDSALLHRFLEVADSKGNLVDGKVTLDREETRWLFSPASPWKQGEYKLEVLSTLEDLAGNKIGRAFDVDTFDRVNDRVASETYTLPFTVGTAQPSTPPVPAAPKP